MSLGGSIIFPREVIDELESKPDLLALMVILVSKARFRPITSRRGQSLEPGQLVTGKRHISSLTRWTESRSYRALKRLQDRNFIEIKSDRRGTVVTIVDWPSYSSFNQQVRTTGETPSSSKLAHRDPSSSPTQTHKKKEAGGKKKEECTWSTVDQEQIDWPKALEVALSVRRKLGKPRKSQDQSLLLKAAALSQMLSEHWLYDAVEGVLQCRPQNKFAYLHKILGGSSPSEFNKRLSAVRVPEDVTKTFAEYEPPSRSREPIEL